MIRALFFWAGEPKGKQLETEAYPGGICWLRVRADVGLQIVSFARISLGLVLPEGLELVGRYLAGKPGTTLATLWQRLQAQRLAAKALLAAEPEMMTATLGVTAAFELSWQDLTPAAQEVGKLLSVFAGAEIPWGLVQACLSEGMRKIWRRCGMGSWCGEVGCGLWRRWRPRSRT